VIPVKKTVGMVAILAICIILIAMLFTNILPVKKSEIKQATYVGVTYCGNSVSEGKLLIDKVKDYTNLFVLQSGTLQRDFKSVDELGDYATSEGLYFLPYFGMIIQPQFSLWLQNATQRWGTHLLGVYYGDEPGGKMLDDYVKFSDTQTGDSITKTTYGDILVQKPNGTEVVYEIGGNIRLYQPTENQTTQQIDGTQNPSIHATFYPNGTITATRTNPSDFTNEPISDYRPTTNYQNLMEDKPFKDSTDIANKFCANDQENIQLLKNSTKLFTSDYALYWFDYMAGYDVVLAQIGWNNSLAQQAAFERGATNLQNKEWGVIITWKYDHPPYLASGAEISNQLQIAYGCGAKYFVIFNYYGDQDGQDGSMQEEHFLALKEFWKTLNENSLPQSYIRAKTALVLPKDYACAFRWKEDKIWGVIQPNETSIQIYNLVQETFANNTLDCDIIYSDTNFSTNSNYREILYWNKKG
jgi:hypothetical protein